MHHQALVAFALTLGLGFALSTASCGPTCKNGAQSCGTQNGSAAGDSSTTEDAGTSNNATCAYLTTVRGCMDAFCGTTSNPFCTCYKRGYDIDQSCNCVPFDAKKFCDQAAASGADSAGYDCSSRTGAVATICVGVQ